MTVHRFAHSLAQSHVQEDAPWWEGVYRQAFPGFDGMHSVRQDGWAQRGGIDRQVFLRSGRTVTVDEKVRDRDWPDFALERWSDLRRGTAGWVQKSLACDYIAYAFVPSQRCYLLPFQTLRAAWRRYGREWVALAESGLDRADRKSEGCHAGLGGFSVIWALNDGYVTESVGVPIGVLMSALADAMLVTWTAETEDAAAA